MDSLRHTRIVLDATYLILNIKQAQRAPKYDNDKKQESEMLEIAPPEHCWLIFFWCVFFFGSLSLSLSLQKCTYASSELSK